MLPISDNVRSRTTPYVTVGLIGTCVVVFVLELMNPDLAKELSFKPAYLLSRQFFSVGPGKVAGTMLMSIFLHGGFLHIVTNMLALWVFGDNVEDRMGHGRYLGFYLLCGIIGNLAHALSSVFGLLHGAQSMQIGVVGASGAIAGVMGAYLVLLPGAWVRTLVILFFFITIVMLPAPLLIGLWFLIQVFSGLVSLGVGSVGVAYWAHVGGFVVGYLVGRGMRWRGPPRRKRPRVIELDVRDV